jgi:hypothetical protein
MAASSTDVANIAMLHLGQTTLIQDLDSDTTTEAKVMRQFYEPTLKEALRAFNWGFAKRYVTLGLVTQDTDDDHPNDEWLFSYRYPSNCLLARRIISGLGPYKDLQSNEIPFEISADDTGQLIFTDQDDAQLEYTQYIQNPTLWSPDFLMAFTKLLASRSARGVTAGDPGGLTASLYKEYLIEISAAKARSVNEQKRGPGPETDSIQARD